MEFRKEGTFNSFILIMAPVFLSGALVDSSAGNK